MLGLWILLCAAFLTDSCAGETLQHGRQLSIRLQDWIKKLDFTSMDRSLNYTIWSDSVTPHRGRVVGGKGNNRRFVISSVNFDDQGTYTLLNFRNQVSSVTSLKVISSTSIKYCVADATLKISLDGLKKDEASLSFSNQKRTLTLVQRGSPMWNHNYNKQIKVTNSSIQVVSVSESDVGQYTLSDLQGRQTQVITLKIIDAPVKVNDVQLQYGQKLRIKLPVQTKMLMFTSKSQNYTIWSSSVTPKRGNVTGRGDDRHFLVNYVNFDDEAAYTQWNSRDKVIAVTNVKILCSTDTQSCVAGATLSISLDGLEKNKATLRFSNQDKNLMLVQQGIPVWNLPERERIKVTSSSVSVLRVNDSDVGQYTLFDLQGRQAKVVMLKINDTSNLTDRVELQFGDTLSIKLPVEAETLTFTSKSQNDTIWPSSTRPNRGNVSGLDDKRSFIINTVNFDDQGTYIQRNHWNARTYATEVKVLSRRYTQDCVTGKTLSISLNGLEKDQVSLRFSNKKVDHMLVERGSPVGNLSGNYNQISVTNSDIQVLNFSVLHVGQYTLLDGQGRVAKVITADLNEPLSWKPIFITVAVILLAGICIYVGKRAWQRKQAVMHV
ncbi:uncharacterized protein LOC108434763 [Pygocentrus nattereri]|uniref:Uncharacterized protein n=1 Tax=Pygocentrus nattereri TaxID=42514 RepID=A0A3B4DYU7_PYGNA|nr:uncharacterized protein LOC108434763 [Pygocentrus nattereri]